MLLCMMLVIAALLLTHLDAWERRHWFVYVLPGLLLLPLVPLIWLVSLLMGIRRNKTHP